MRKLLFGLKYLSYLLTAKSAYGIHSPFVFSLYNEVIRKKGNYYSFDKIEYQRKKFLASQKTINVVDFGTGKSGKKTIREIALRSLKSKKYGQLLFRLVYYLKPSIILELGTSFGITTCYLASANSNASVITIEGCAETVGEAKKGFSELLFKNIQVETGDFDTVLPSIISRLPSVDFVFVDGNHKKKPTLNYFHQLMSRAHNNSVFVFDDIHWSSEMEEAWTQIKKHSEVTLTIDLFFLGLVFFRKEQAKEHFTLRF